MSGDDPEGVLQRFRERFYGCMYKRRDALFKLTDSVLTVGHYSSPPHLSLTFVHRRSWGSLYAALREGRVDEEALRELFAQYPLAADHSSDSPRVYAVDVSPWPRCEAKTSPERGYLYHASRHSGGKPVVAGWSYQIVAELGFARDSWTAPVDARRILPHENDDEIAAEQVKALVSKVCSTGADPLFIFDAGYDPVKLSRYLEDCCAQLLVRLACNRSFYFEPTPESRKPVGRGVARSTARSSTSKTLLHGRVLHGNTAVTMTAMDRCVFAPGRDCIPRPARPTSAMALKRRR